jgi:hypothetical protein
MTKDKNIIHETFVAEILTILTVARQKAYTAVNFSMVDAYWHIGKRIVEEEQLGENRGQLPVSKNNPKQGRFGHVSLPA